MIRIINEALNTTIGKLANKLGVTSVHTSDEHRTWGEYDPMYRGMHKHTYFGYATLTTRDLGKFTVSYRTDGTEGSEIPLDGAPWEFLKKKRLTPAQRSFIKANENELWELISNVGVSWSTEEIGVGGEGEIEFNGYTYFIDDTNGKKIWNTIIGIMKKYGFLPDPEGYLDYAPSSEVVSGKYGLEPNAVADFNDDKGNSASIYVYSYRSDDRIYDSAKDFTVYAEFDFDADSFNFMKEIISVVSNYEGWVVRE